MVFSEVSSEVLARKHVILEGPSSFFKTRAALTAANALKKEGVKFEFVYWEIVKDIGERILHGVNKNTVFILDESHGVPADFLKKAIEKSRSVVLILHTHQKGKEELIRTLQETGNCKYHKVSRLTEDDQNQLLEKVNMTPDQKKEFFKNAGGHPWLYASNAVTGHPEQPLVEKEEFLESVVGRARGTFLYGIARADDAVPGLKAKFTDEIRKAKATGNANDFLQLKHFTEEEKEAFVMSGIAISGPKGKPFIPRGLFKVILGEPIKV